MATCFFPFHRRPAIHHENEILSFLSDARFLFNIFDTSRNAATRSIFARKFHPRFSYAIDAINFYGSDHLEEVNANEELDKKQHEDFTNSRYYRPMFSKLQHLPESGCTIFFLICSFFCRANTFKKYNLQNIASLKKWYNQEAIESISCSRL